MESGAWRSIYVRLNADVGPYVTSMGRAESATRKFGTGVLTAAGGVDGLDKASKKLDRFGNQMSMKVTLPVAAAGAASVKMASDFNTSFTQMTSLAGVSAAEVDGLKESVNGLSGKTAQSPQELAKALYFIRSSGVDGAAALETLEASAKASAIGLGETAGIADAVTSALNTYGTDTLSAAQATDILTASVTAGKGEAAEFAPQLGRLLPVAQNLGIGFDEVAGSLAFLTQTSGDSSQSATQLSGILQKLLKPTQQGREELEKVGLSAEKLRKVAGEQGLVPALQLLQSKLGSNSEALGRVFDDSEGLVGVLGLLRNGGKDAAGVIDDVSKSAGLLDEKFTALQGTDEFKFQKALADLQRVAIQVGEDLIPILANVADGVSAVADVFTSLPQPVQNTLFGLAGVAAALGPIAKLAGGTASGLSAIAKAAQSDSLAKFRSGLAGVAETGGGAAQAMGLVSGAVIASPAAMAVGVAAIAGLVYALVKMTDESKQAKEAAKDLAQQAAATGKTTEQVFRENLARSIAGLDGGIKGFGKNARYMVDDLQYVGTNVEELGNILFAGEKAFEAYIRQIESHDGKPHVNPQNDVKQIRLLREEALLAAEQDKKYRLTQENLKVTQDDLGVSTRDTTAATRDAARAASDVTGAVEGSNTAWRDQLDILGLVNAQLRDRAGFANDAFTASMDYESAKTGVRAAVDQLKEARKGGDKTEIAAAEQRLAEAIARQSEAAVTNARAIGEVMGKKLSDAEATAIQRTELEKLTESTGYTSEALRTLIDRLTLASAQYKVDIQTAEAERKLRQLARDREVMVTIDVDWSRLGKLVKLAGTLGVLDANGDPVRPGAINAERLNRRGGLYSFASGGVTPAHIGFGTRYKWAEPETGGEAFIPRRGDRTRSLSILAQAGRWYGMDVVPAWKQANQVPPAPIPFGGALVPTAGDGTNSVDNSRTMGDVHLHGIPSDPRRIARELAVAQGVFG